jgi:hypothetical protein
MFANGKKCFEESPSQRFDHDVVHVRAHHVSNISSLRSHHLNRSLIIWTNDNVIEKDEKQARKFQQQNKKL